MHSILKSIFTILSLSVLLASISCSDDGIDVPDTPLNGFINGEEWNYKFGNAYIFSSDGKYTLTLLSEAERGDDPCPFINSSNPHLKVVLPLRQGSYSLPLNMPAENLRFVFGNGTVLSANSGFIEIFAIDQAQVAGYIQAQIDEDNTVEGQFFLEIC